MKKIFQRIGWLLLVISLIVATAKVVLVYFDFSQIKAYFNKQPPPPIPVKKPVPQVIIPDIRELAMQQGGVVAPTEEQLKEEKQYFDEHVEMAGRWLSSTDAKQRHIGAEQLSAYQTPTAEIMLLKALTTDTDQSVRTAAVESLLAFKSLSDSAIVGLLTALGDTSETVQSNALLALEKQLIHEENGSARYNSIMSGLKKQMKSPHLSKDMHDAVQVLINDRQP